MRAWEGEPRSGSDSRCGRRKCGNAGGWWLGVGEVEGVASAEVVDVLTGVGDVSMSEGGSSCSRKIALAACQARHWRERRQGEEETWVKAGDESL